jgi:hypothetical protein
LIELKLYGRCCLLHPNCHHLWSEQVEVEGMDMPEVEGINMVEEQNHLTNHQLGEEDMNMMGINMMEVGGMDTVEKHYHPINHRPKVKGMDRKDSDTGDMTVEVEVIEREPEGVVLTRH